MGIQEQAVGPSFSVPITVPQSQSGVQLGSLFHAQAKLQAIICGGDSAGRTRGAGLELWASCSQGAHNRKPVNHPRRTNRTADRSRAGRQSEGDALVGSRDISVIR